MGEKYAIFAILPYSKDSFLYDKLEFIDEPAKLGKLRRLSSSVACRVSKVVKVEAVTRVRRASITCKRLFSFGKGDVQSTSAQNPSETQEAGGVHVEESLKAGDQEESKDSENVTSVSEEAFLDDLDNLSVLIKSIDTTLPKLELNEEFLPGQQKDFEAFHYTCEKKSLRDTLGNLSSVESGESEASSYANQPTAFKLMPNVKQEVNRSQALQQTLRSEAKDDVMMRSLTEEDLKLGASSSVADFKSLKEPCPENPHNGGMSVVYLKGYLYVIGVILNRISTKGVIRTKVNDGECRWERVEDLPIKCPFHASYAVEDNIVLCGGRSKNKRSLPKLDSFMCFKCSQKKWTLGKQKLKVPREKHSLLFFEGVGFVAIGGIGNKEEKLRSVEVFVVHHTSTTECLKCFDCCKWEDRAPMFDARSSFTSAARNQYIYVAGGDVSNEHPNLVSVERYDVFMDKWDRFQPFSVPQRVPMVGFSMNDWICVLGIEPRCFDTSPNLVDSEPSSSNSNATTCQSRDENERVWQPTLSGRILPVVNLKGRAAVIAKLQ